MYTVRSAASTLAFVARETKLNAADRADLRALLERLDSEEADHD